jgi:Predicted transcriptional regulators
MSLEALRQKAGLTRRDLAEISGVHYMKIHQIENGIIKVENITLRVAVKLSDALGCATHDLLGLDQ